MSDAASFILKVTCEDQPGIVAAVARSIAENGGNILECQQFDDAETGRFLMRMRFSCHDIDKLAFELKPTIERFQMKTELLPEARKGRVVIMVSKMDHCMNDLLYRWGKGDLNMELVGIVSNHETYRAHIEGAGLPFKHIPVTKETKAEAEKELLDYISDNEVDLVVLARYMQILSDDLSKRLFGKVINIHHSFLPSFKGAKAYHQAHARGVKLIGATAHYVTPDLDEGPIIEQEVARVDHGDDAASHVRIGRDVECQVLSRAVRWHLEHRVFLNKSKTVVFP
ncbi:MAG: formyltetrahydrofolate deformylase [Pseudomonadota bacterium]